MRKRTEKETKWLQDQFSTMVRHLRKQKVLSIEDGDCRYRTDSGLKCAVGALIPDDLYKEDMEKLNCGAVLYKYPVLNKYIDEDLGEDMQRLHDSMRRTSFSNSKILREWEIQFKHIATDWNLKVPPKD